MSKARKLAEAAAVVDRLSAVLNFSATLANIASNIDREDINEIEKATNSAELKDAIGQQLNERLKGADKVESFIKTDNVQLGIRTERMRGVFTKNGAPVLLDIYIKQPIEFGKGAEFKRPVLPK